MSKFDLFGDKEIKKPRPGDPAKTRKTKLQSMLSDETRSRLLDAFAEIEEAGGYVSDIVVGLNVLREIRLARDVLEPSNGPHQGMLYGARVWTVSTCRENDVHVFNVDEPRLRDMFPAIAEAIRPTRRIRA